MSPGIGNTVADAHRRHALEFPARTKGRCPSIKEFSIRRCCSRGVRRVVPRLDRTDNRNPAGDILPTTCQSVSSFPRFLGPRPAFDFGRTKQRRKTRAQSFLLSSAFFQPSDRPHAECLAGACHGEVNRALSSSRTDKRAWTNFEASLPRVRFYREWDRCLRLNKAVADAILDNHWAPTSLIDFASHREPFIRLLRTLTSSRRGRKLVREALCEWPTTVPAWVRRAAESIRY